MKNIFEKVKFIGDEVFVEKSNNDNSGDITVTKESSVPEFFRTTVLKIIESIEDKCKLKKVGVTSAYSPLGDLAAKLGNSKKRIKTKPITNIYRIVVPYKVIQTSGTNLSGDEFIEDIIKSNGFTKGGYTTGGDKNRIYKYYRTEKNNIYFITFMHFHNFIEIEVMCLENDEEGLKYLKSNEGSSLTVNT